MWWNTNSQSDRLDWRKYRRVIWRFNFGEKLQFLYYARGSLFETKYWLNRAKARELMPPESVQKYATRLSKISATIEYFRR
jgi:four helix bundle protein